MSNIMNRRSTRSYTNKKVEDELIDILLRAAMAAPSAGNGQPWNFVVIKDKDILNEITSFQPYSKMLKEASLAIVVCADIKNKDYHGFWVQDCAAATENILLMAEEIGLGAVWLGAYPNEATIVPLSELLKLPKEIIPLSIVSIGYPKEKVKPEDRYDSSRIHIDRW
ncbi:MAG TPA: nitroreductase family protein [Clostridiaceae bacterium]